MIEKQQVRIDAEKRIDAAVCAEQARLDGIMNSLIRNNAWVFSMGAQNGKTPMETTAALGRFSETLRKLQLGISEMWHPECKGASRLFVRTDNNTDRAANIKEIAAFIHQNKMNKLRMDADDGIFFDPMLADIDPTRYRVKKQPTGLWEKYLPTKGIAIGATNTYYRMYEGTGATAESSPGKMTGINLVGVRNKQFASPVETSAVGYALTTDDQRKAMFAQEPLIEELVFATIQAHRRQVDKTAWLGNLILGLEGAINHAGVGNIQAALNNGARSWKNPAKVNDAIYADIVAALSAIAVNSKEVWTPQSAMYYCLLDRLTFDSLNRRMATGTDTTLRNFITNNNSLKLVPMPAEYLAGTGPGGSDQALFYPHDETVIRFRVNPSIMWAPMQWEDLVMKFIGEFIYGSVETIYPVAMIELFDI